VEVAAETKGEREPKRDEFVEEVVVVMADQPQEEDQLRKMMVMLGQPQQSTRQEELC
jgi:hypothetical protein